MLWSFSDALVVFPSLSLSLSHCLYRCVCVRMMCSTLVCFLPSLDSFCVSFSLSVLSWVTHSGSCSFSLVQSSFGASVVVVSLSLSADFVCHPLACPRREFVFSTQSCPSFPFLFSPFPPHILPPLFSFGPLPIFEGNRRIPHSGCLLSRGPTMQQQRRVHGQTNKDFPKF